LKSKIYSFLKILFFLGIGLFLIWWIVQGLTQQEIGEIKNAFRQANYWWVFLSIVLGLMSHMSRAYRWQMLIEPMGYKLRFGNTFAAVMVGYLANYAFPRLGEVWRCGIVNQYDRVPVNKVFGTVIAERAIDMIILLSLFIITVFLQFYRLEDMLVRNLSKKQDQIYGLVTNQWGILAIAIGVILILLGYFFRQKLKRFSLYDRIVSIVKGFIDGLKSIKDIQKRWTFLFHSFFIWFMYLSMIIVCFYSMEQTASLGLGAAMAILVFGAIGIIAVQGGIGAYQAIVTVILVLYGVDKPIGFAFGWIIWSGQTIMNIGLGLLSLVFLPIINNTLYAKPDDRQVENI